MPKRASAEGIDEPGGRNPCPFAVCDGSGWILGPEDIARPCECRERQVAKGRLRGIASVIPAKYQGVSFDRPPVPQMDDSVVIPVREFCSDITARLSAGEGLWFHGGSGTGKTTLAMLVSKCALEAGRSVAIYSLPKLLARIRRTYDAQTGEQSYSELFERLSTVDLLHIDDLGAENTTEWVLEQLYALINERYEGERSLLVTTNHSESALRRQIGNRIVSRMLGMCDSLEFEGRDHRDLISPTSSMREGGPGREYASGGALGPLDH